MSHGSLTARLSACRWSAGGERRAVAAALDGKSVQVIHTDLTASVANLTTAERLAENQAMCFQGPVKVGPFDIEGAIAREWMRLPSNANGKHNAVILRPNWIARDVVQRPRDVWIIDFDGYSKDEAAFFSRPFAHVLEYVKPLRDNNNDRQRRAKWWLLGRAGTDYRRATAGLSRFIVTPRVSKHRLFVWADATVVPDSRLICIVKSDDLTFGILHSRFHEIWSLATCSWHGVGNDPTYNIESCFETFPFPPGLSPNLPVEADDGNAHVERVGAATRALVQARDTWLNPPELVARVPEVVAGFPDRIVPRDEKSAATLKKRTLTALYNTRGTPEGAWLDNLHKDLDAAVALAYGWPADLSEEDALARLLALNLARTPV